MEIDVKMIKELRRRTSRGMMECKSVLVDCGWDIERAKEKLIHLHGEHVIKEMESIFQSGTIGVYNHPNGRLTTVAVLKCESSIVGNDKEFMKLAYNIALHVACTGSVDVKYLMHEVYIKDVGMKVQDYIENMSKKFSEEIIIESISKFEIISKA